MFEPVYHGGSKSVGAIDPGLPVVFASGYTRERISANLLDSGAVCFLQKPFRTVDLLAAVRQLIEPNA